MSFPTKLDPWGKKIWKSEDKLEVLKEVEEGESMQKYVGNIRLTPPVYNWKERYQPIGYKTGVEFEKS